LIAAILAGGLGTRLRSVVSDVPKPLAPVDGKPFLLYLMEYWRGEGVDSFLLSIGYKYEKIVEAIGDTFLGAPVEYVIEEHPLGTGGAVAEVAARSDSTMLLLNGDTFFPVPLKELLRFHKASQSDFSFSLFLSNDTERYMGVKIDDRGRLSVGAKATSDSEVLLVNGGVYCVEPTAILAAAKTMHAPFALESDLLPLMETNGSRLFGQEYDRPFIDIGIPDDYQRAYEVIKDGTNG
jgi:D-glycero-alpha-D-manno-heptose 1-phosphate guanylyltransferase